MEGLCIKNYEYIPAFMCFLPFFAGAVKVVTVFVMPDWVFQTGHFAPLSFPAYGGKIQATHCAGSR
jgi:hypothetical protein